MPTVVVEGRAPDDHGGETAIVQEVMAPTIQWDPSDDFKLIANLQQVSRAFGFNGGLVARLAS